MIDAFLFDLDGTLIDSDPIHARIFVDFLGARGVTIDEAFYAQNIHGRLNADIFADLLPHEDAAEMSDAKEAEYRRQLATGAFQPFIPGATAFIDAAIARGRHIAIVTNAPSANAPAALEAVGLGGRFEVVVAADTVARGKPAPDPYLEAMRRLGVTPETCIAFEDSPSGLAAARAAGLTVVGLATSLSPEALTGHGAALVIRDFTDPALQSFLSTREGALA